METLFWASVAIVLYVYAGYPLLLLVWAKLRPRRTLRFEKARELPTVSVVIAARNEARRLPDRIRNILEQTYPSPIEVIVVSDGSTDGTAQALSAFTNRIHLIALPAGGKAAALNAGVAAARGEIIVFADARQRFAPDAILALASNFADADVGAATGELLLDSEIGTGDHPAVAESVGVYWKYEKWLRKQESRIWSVIGATGAIYAMRRGSWRPLPHATLLDDVLAPMRVVLAGQRIVFDDRARAFDQAPATARDEARRKTRTLAGNYQILALEPRLLNPLTNPVWVQYVSHKLGRLIVPWALLAALVSNGLLALHSWPYALALLLQLCFYGLAVFGAKGATRESTRQLSDELGPPSSRPVGSLQERHLSASGRG